MERNAEAVCPFCGCLYDHDELVALYDEAEREGSDKDAVLAQLGEFYERVLAQPENVTAAQG